VREKTVGVLNINSHTIGRYSPEAIELAEAFADQASVALQNARLHDFEVKQIEQELSIARDIQTSLLPSAAPELDQLEIVAYSQPARQVSGDYFQYLPMPSGRLGIAVGDVSGKGIPAAILMAVMTTAMRHLEIANGGMVQPYVRNGKAWEFVPVGGYPLGLSQRVAYDSKTITLTPGSLLLLMSDGVVEAQNTAGEFFGFERLEALLNELPAETDAQTLVDRILAAVDAHLDGDEAQDDITILAIRSREIVLEAEQPAGTIEETIPAKPVKLAAVAGET
jgi:serine phosphatase RsbU (regulator of sigma subunit)